MRMLRMQHKAQQLAPVHIAGLNSCKHASNQRTCSNRPGVLRPKHNTWFAPARSSVHGIAGRAQLPMVASAHANAVLVGVAAEMRRYLGRTCICFSAGYGLEPRLYRSDNDGERWAAVHSTPTR
jgi:hypothetical protein